MSTLIFDLSYDDLVGCFGTDRVERSVREDAEALGSLKQRHQQQGHP